MDCASNINVIKDLSARKAYQNIKLGSFESLAQCHEHFRETYTIASFLTIDDKESKAKRRELKNSRQKRRR